MEVVKHRSGMMMSVFFASLMLAGRAFSGVGAVKTYEDWYTVAEDDGSYVSAITANLDGDTLAEHCYIDRHCEWRFSTKNFTCTPGVKSVVLANSKAGANSVNTECVGSLVKELWTTKILQWSSFEMVVDNNQELALAIPGQGTSFRVIRFSLRGMKAATASIGGAIVPGAAKASPARDVTL